MSTKFALLVSTSLLVLASANAPASAHSKLLLLPQTGTSNSAQTKQTTSTEHVTTPLTPALKSNLATVGATAVTDHASQQPLILPLHPLHTIPATATTKVTTGTVPLTTPVLATIQKVDGTAKGATGPVLPEVTFNKTTIVQTGVPAGAKVQPVHVSSVTPVLTTATTTTAVSGGGKGLFAELHKIVGPLQQPKPLVDPLQAHRLQVYSQSLLKVNSTGAVSKANIAQFVGLNRIAGTEQVLTGAIGLDKFRSVMSSLNDRIAKGDVKLVPITGDTGKAGGQAQGGDSSTIVLNQSDNGKTIYVPASQLSGPDKRTIDVNCSGCKVVIVGDRSNGGSVTDDKTIVVNGNGDKIVDQGDSSSGAAGKNGGQVTDNSKIVVNGNGDKVSDGGDKANGGSGASGVLAGQNGGQGGTVTDNRKVIVDGHGDKVAVGTDQAKGGNGGDGLLGGSNGGNGGTVNDNRTGTINGNGSVVSLGGSNVDGGNGGSAAISGAGASNGGDGGSITDHRNVDDNGFGNGTQFGGDQANGGNGGNS